MIIFNFGKEYVSYTKGLLKQNLLISVEVLSCLGVVSIGIFFCRLFVSSILFRFF